MAALLEDTYGVDGALPRKVRLDLTRAGLAERARAAGVVGSLATSAECTRAGAVLVLCGWGLFMVAGAVFGKFTDNWVAGTPPAAKSLATVGYGTVIALGLTGCALVAGAAIVIVPAFFRLLRGGGWPRVRRPIARAAVVCLAAGMLLVAGLQWAHHLNPHARNGGSSGYSALFVLVCVATVAALAAATAAAVAVARLVDLTPGVLHLLGRYAIALCALMVLFAAGVAAWWASEAAHSAHALRSAIGNGMPYTSGTAPPTLVATAVLLGSGLVLAMLGLRQVARGRAMVH